MPWKLGAPVSREVVLPGSGASLLVAGGLTDSSTTTRAVFSLDTASGGMDQRGSLATGVHDSAGAIVSGTPTLFGGGAGSTTSSVQTVSTTGPGRIIGSLPAPRSDDTAVTEGSTTYIVGGYDGDSITDEVLGTTDGIHFRIVANLVTPVRYAAVAASGGRVYVFGGQVGTAENQATDEIQMVDPAAGKTTVVGHLPMPLEAAAAFTVAGRIYVAGGNAPATGSGQAASGVTTKGAVWAFDVAGNRVVQAGQLQVPVSNVGVAVVGGRAWLVGGESNGNVVATVQVVTPNGTLGTRG